MFGCPIRVRLGRNRALTLSSTDDLLNVSGIRTFNTKFHSPNTLGHIHKENPPHEQGQMGRGMRGELCGVRLS